MEKRYSLRFALALAFFASALTCAVGYVIIGRDVGLFTDRFESVRRYGALLGKIEELYIGEYDSRAVTDEAMRGAVVALDDNWSYYLTEEEYGEYVNYSNNQYAGIGVEVKTGEDIGGLLVVSVYPGSPAERSGIAVSDIITEVDGESLAGLSMEEASALMDRNIGQTMELTVLHEDGNTEVLETEYSLIFKDPVQYKLLPGGIGYISLENFDYGSAASFISAVKVLREEGATSLAFDVRTNGGGKVSEMTYILDYLLPEGEVFIRVDRYGNEDINYSDENFVDMPAVVLVNSYSYSAAEYFTVMLSEYGYAKTVGEPTTGKNRSQETFEMPGGGALHISTAEYLTKNRVSLFDTGGYTPDYEIQMTDEDYARLYYGQLDIEDDVQLQKAIELLAG